MSRGSLRLRLLVAAAISIAIALALTGFALVNMFERQVREHRSELIVGAAVLGFAVGGLIALRRRR